MLSIQSYRSKAMWAALGNKAFVNAMESLVEFIILRVTSGGQY